MIKSLYELDLADKYVGNKRLGSAVLLTSSPMNTLDLKTLALMKQEEYVSKDRNHSWISGIEVKPHVTVRWGLLPGVLVKDMEKTVEHMPVYGKLFITGWEIFPSPYVGEQYDCVVALVKPSTPWLRDLHTQLSVLPNLVTFPEFRPHVTIGYFNKGFWTADVADRYMKDNVSVGPWEFKAGRG